MSGLPSRDEIDAKYKWRLEDIYESDELWERDFNRVKNLLLKLEGFRGRINSPGNLMRVLKLKDEIGRLNDRLFTYARMRRDEDNTRARYQALADRAVRLSVEVAGGLSFIEPEILALPEEKLLNFIDGNIELKLYRHYIEDLLRMKNHILDAKSEKILADAGEMAQAPGDIFRMLDNADIRFPSIRDENGDEVELTKGRYMKFMESRDREVRKSAFRALHNTYAGFINTLGAAMSANVKRDIFYKNQRKFESCLEASLFADNIPVRVYENLINAIHQRLDLLHRYVRLRKKVLGLRDLHMYDLYVPLVKNYNREISYEEARDMVIEGLAPMGEEYIDILKEGFASGWIDVYENRGKTGGAYSWGAYGTHPYVLLNFQGRMDDVFTIAHEMGHAIHTYYSFSRQPYIYAQYAIFVAEVASTCNEAVLINSLLEKAGEREEKMFLLNHFMDQFRGTVFRQVMFAEFEKIIHELAEKGEPLNGELLKKIYHELNAKYYGPDIVIDPEIDYEWARIPHFYTSFYVYKYATGFSAAIAISRKILNQGMSAVEKYREFLSGGSSDYPLELLKKVGVDLTEPEPVMEALEVFEKLLDEYESMI
ncbi:oligoendopeptidase F [Thermoanaerobacterium sp. DL9XJH110]|uniref:oligoendopeptidase F n=1 Tax=Thermoanaerobacterium sp. DL9XJH110 TaxID=3386643 RepID=UPI003BB512B8